MKLSEYLSKSGETLEDYLNRKKRAEKGTTTLSDYRSKTREELASTDISDIYDTLSKSNGGYIDKDTLSSYNDRLADYIGKYSKIYDSSNKDQKSYLDSLNELSNGVKSYYDVMSNYSNEDEYNYSVASSMEGSEGVEARKKWYEELNNKISSTTDKDALNYLNTLKKQYERGQKVSDDYYTPRTEEFEQNASYRDYNNPTKDQLWVYDTAKSDYDYNMGYGYYTYDGSNFRDSNGNVVTEPTAPVIEDKLGMFLSASDDDIDEALRNTSANTGDFTNTWASVITEGYSSRWSQLSEDEIDIYYDLLKREGQESAYKFLSDMETELGRRDLEEYQAEISGANALQKIMLNIASIPMNVVGGIPGAIEDAYNIVKGNEINPYSYAHSASNAAGAIREDTANIINNATGNASLPWVGTTFGDVYQSIMSAGDSLFGSTFGGTGYGIMMGLNSATSEAKELYEQGASVGQIASGSLLAGAAEMIFEKVSLEYFFENFLGSTAKSKTELVMKILAQGGVEASEEVATEIANTISNALVLGSQSDWRKYVDKYISDGYSQGEAVWEALKNDVAPEVINAGIGGFISGGAMGGAGSAINYGMYNSYLKNSGQKVIDLGGVDALTKLAMETANEFKGNNKLEQLANDVTKNATAKNVGLLNEEVENYRSKNNQKSIENSLVEQMVKDGVKIKEAKAQAKGFAEQINQSLNGEDVDLTEALKNTSVKKVYDNLTNNEYSDVKVRNEHHEETRKGIIKDYVQGKIDKAEAEKTLSEKFTSSDDGKEFNTTTGEEITLANSDVVASNENGKLTLKLDNGSTIEASNVSFGSKGEAVLYATIADMGVETHIANTLISSVEGTDSKNMISTAIGIRDAFWYGSKGINYSELENGVFTSRITEQQRKIAYNLGKTDAIYATSKKTAPLTVKKGVKYKDEYKVDNGRIRGAKFDNLNEQKLSGISLAKMLSKLGANVYVFESTLEQRENGKENGSYVSSDGSIHIDINSGSDGQGLVAYTVSHEFTHFIEEWSPQKFKKYADILFEELGYDNKSVTDMLTAELNRLREVDEYKSKTENELRDIAYSEVVAKCSEKLLTDTDVLQKIADRLAKTDKKLLQKIVDFFKGLVQRLKEAYDGQLSLSPLGNEAIDTIKRVEAIRDAFADAAVDALQNYRNADVEVLNNAGFNYDEETGTVYSRRFSTGEENEANVDRDELINSIVNITGISKKEAENYLRAEEVAAMSIKGTFLDFEGNEKEVAIKSNSDYPQGTIDLTNICTKRVPVTNLTNRLQEALPEDLFTADDYADIRLILMNDGRIVACGLCFVEDRRQYLGEIAHDFINEWTNALNSGSNLKRLNSKGEVKDVSIGADLANRYGVKPGLVNPTKVRLRQDMFSSSTQWFKLQKNNPYLAAAFEAFNNARGQSAGRLLLDRAEYKREILGWSEDKVKSVNDVGGLRIFSFSDFEAVHLLDLLQIIEDCAAKGVKIQGYTKQTKFAKLVSKTGLKLNRSFIPYGATGLKMVNGKQVLAIDTVEGINNEDENFLDESDNPNVGNNITGISDEQIHVAMLDNFFHYIIPFHTNKKAAANKKLGVANWRNYKLYQTDKTASSSADIKKVFKLTYQNKMNGMSDTDAYDKALKDAGIKFSALKEDKMVNIYTDVLSDPSVVDEKSFLIKYLEVCNERDIVPRYAQFLNLDKEGNFVYTEGYTKFLVDFKLFDYATGKILTQGLITPNFDSEFIKSIIEDEFKKTERERNGADYPEELYNDILNYIRAKHGYKDVDTTTYKKYKKIVKEMVEKANSDENGTRGASVSPSVLKSNRYSEQIDNVKQSVKNVNADLGINTVEAKEQLTDVMNTEVVLHSDRENHFEETYSAIGKELLYYPEGDAKPDLTLVETVNAKTGAVEQTIKNFGEKPANYVPKKVGICYKLFEQHPDGSLHALFAGANKKNPGKGVAIGEWVYSQGFPLDDSGVSSMGLRARYGWHLSAGLPSAPHLMSSKAFERGYPSKKDLHPAGSKRVWVEMYYDASTDFNSVADSTKAGDIYGLIPFGGYYAFKENNQSEWIISSAVKINRILKEEERQQILKDNGWDEKERWRLKYKATEEEKSAKKKESDALKKANKGKSRAEVYATMRENIASRIIDNPEIANGNNVKYSDRDSEGNKLSKEQQEFFKDSRARDEEGKLFGVYHASDADFYIFEKKGGKRSLGGLINYDVDTKGFFFSADYDFARKYGKNIRKFYLNAKKPLIELGEKLDFRTLGDHNETVYRDEEKIRDLYYVLEPVINDIIDDYVESTEKYYHNEDKELKERWYLEELYKYYDADIYNKVSLPWEVIDSKGFLNSIERMKELGYDSIVVSEGKDSLDSWFILDSSQAKLTSNTNPTSNPDIRYSDRILMGSEFSGGGMLEAGLVYQMLDKEFAVEYDEKIAAVYRDNWGDHIYAGPERGDVHNFNISKHAKDLFYFHASPVCHNFSKAKHNHAEHPMDIKSARKVANDLEVSKPQVFTVENAPEYLNSKSLKIITDKLDDLGYKWRAKVYNSADYGSATSRERCILIAVKTGDLPSEPTKMPRTNSWDKVTRDLWSGLKVAKAENGKPMADFFVKALRNTKKLKGIFNEDGTITVDRPLLVITTTAGNEITFALEGSLCPTLTTKCGEGKLILPGSHISLDKPNANILRVSPKFMGTIQGLPDDYNYGKAATRAFTIIGNGIPTHLTKAVIGGVLDSAYEQTHEGKKLYSDRDSDGNKLSNVQKEFFKDSVVRDENGLLIPVYHGSNEDFNTFDIERYGEANGHPEKAIFFTNVESVAKQFTTEGKTRKFYINITNPLNLNNLSEGQIDEIAGMVNFGLPKDEVKGFIKDYIKAGNFFALKHYIDYEKVQSLGYDGVTVRWWSDYNISNQGKDPDLMEYAIFDSSQAKLTSNQKPTSSNDIRYSERDVFGFTVDKNARVNEDLLEELSIYDPSAKVDRNGNITVYHRTNEKNAEIIRRTGIMKAKEDALFFSSQHTGYADGYGDTVLTFSIPSTVLELNDIFDGEVHFDVPLKRTNGEWKLNVSKYLVEDAKYSDREGISNRSLLANALETVTQNDAEYSKLQQYKKKIELMNAEENRLSDIKAKIKELSFAKGHRDSEQIRRLQKSAKEIEGRINYYDKQLFNLEASEPLKKVLAREYTKAKQVEAKKYRESLNEYRQKSAETVRAIINKNQESRKKAVEGRNKTEVRNKVKKVVTELNNYLRDNKVLIGMQKVVAEALNSINMDTVGADERVDKYNELIAKTSDPAMIEELTKSRDRIAKQGENLADKLAKLRMAYADIINSDDPLIANSHDEVIENKIEEVIQNVGNTSIRDMSLEQLESVYDMYKMILTSVRQANKAFKLEKAESIAELGSDVRHEVKDVGGYHDREVAATRWLKKFGWKALKPIYAMRMIGSDTLTELYQNVRKGEDTWYRDMSEAKSFKDNQYKKHGYSNWDFNKEYTFTSKSGKSFTMTLDQIMTLYAFSKRPQAIDHLVKGGIVFDTSIEVTEKKHGVPVKYNVNTATAFNLSEETIIKINATLTDEQRAFVDEMQAYLSDVMGEKGNEVSLALYGVKLYKEKVYFPLKSAKQFMYQSNEVSGEVRIKNSGFSKSTVAHANNPIIMSNFMDIWAGHVNDMSMYHSFVLPLEDFNRVWNYKTRTDDKLETMSVKQALQDAYGTGVNEYISTMLTDLNGGARQSGAEEIGKLMGLAKKGAVFASASVTIQQPSAVCRAMAYINPKYFGKTIGKALNFKQHSAEWEQCKKYAPIAGIKEMGYFDTGMGQSSIDWMKSEDYEGFRNKLEAFFKDGGYRDEILSKAPSLADELTWCHIWNATKAWVADTTDLTGEALLIEAGNRFTEVITLTQVYDSVLSRSGLMRSKDTGMKMATSFMAEPTTTMNMVADAIVSGKRIGGRAGAKVVSNVVGSVTASIVLNSLLKSIVVAWRHGADDDDKNYIERYGQSALEDFIDNINPLTYIPFLKDIVSLFQGYSVDRMDMSLFEDFANSIKALDSSTKSTYQKVSGIIGSVAAFFGVPIKNIERDLRPIIKKIIEAFK